MLVLLYSSFLNHQSCKKDTAVTPPVAAKNNSTPSPTSTSYINLQVGNYWVYNIYNVDTAGVETFANSTDSVYIQKDTIVGGKTYYYFNHVNSTAALYQDNMPMIYNWVTDSSGFLKGISHYVLLDPVHLNDTIKTDTMTYGVILYVLPQTFTNEVVPAGTFSGVSMNTRMRYTHPNPFNGNPLSVNYYKYATGIGLCHSKTGYVSQPKSGYSWQLLRYHI